MSRKIRLGYAPLSQPYYSKEWAQKIRDGSLSALGSMTGIELHHPVEMITTEEDARKTATDFKHKDVDVLLMQSVNCDLAIPATILSQECPVPLLVWSTPEPLLQDRPLFANSLCGGMIITSTLRRLGVKYKHVHGAPDDAQFMARMAKSIEAAAIIPRLKESRLGLIGYQVPGFHHVSFDEMLLRRAFAVQLQHMDISELHAEAKNVPTNAVEAEAKAIRGDSREAQDVRMADFRNSALLSMSIKNLCQKYGLQGVAVKCMPELLSEFQIVPCAALGKLTEDGVMAACEGDVVGALTMLVEYYLTGVQPFFVDLISIDERSNTGVGWHCGNGPASIAEDAGKITHSHHSILSEPPLGLARDLVSKTGEVTFARLSERETGYMVFAAGGEAIKMDSAPRGSSMNIRFHEPIGKISQFLFEEGVENHFAIVYGDIREQLRDLAKWLNMESAIF